jgi:two-component system, NarL family, invasion response regulator UvrY
VAGPPPVAVLIVDDQAPFRRAARAVVGATPGFEVVAEAETGEAAVAMAGELNPGLVLMDINLPGISGIEATRQIVAAHPDTVVMLLSTYRAEDVPSDATECGAATYVNKEEFGPDVVEELWARRAPA